MKALFSGKTKFSQGVSTLEILIAAAILTLSLTAIITVIFGNQSLATDTQTNDEAIAKAQALLEDKRAISRNDFSQVYSYPSPVSDGIYNKDLQVLDLTQCKKQATSTVTWIEGGRTLSVDFSTYLTDISGFLALGGDCDVNPPMGGWNPPVLFARDTLNPGKFNALDAFKKIVYLGSDEVPNLYIADTRSAILQPSSDQALIIPQQHHDFANHFNNAGTQLDEINDLDVYKAPSGKIYAFLATASSTAQLVVMDVTDINNPVIAKNSGGVLAKRKLAGVAGLYPEGWRIYYYDHYVYITTRETSGPEFHIFDASDPTDPTEIGSGTKLKGCTPPNGSTVNDFVVRDGIAYFADDKANCELMIYDVSQPSTPSFMSGASVDLPGTEKGESLFLVGNKLYFGRQKNSGNEFYIFDASSPRTVAGGLPIIGGSDPKKEMGKDITGIRVSGNFAFLASYGDSSGGLKVWNISNPLSIQPINLTFNFGNKLKALDFDSDYLYAAGESTPNFQMLYSP